MEEPVSPLLAQPLLQPVPRIVASWVEHLRQHQRTTHDDRAAHEAAYRLHRDEDPPRIVHLIVPREDGSMNRVTRANSAAYRWANLAESSSAAISRAKPRNRSAMIIHNLCEADVELTNTMSGIVTFGTGPGA